MKKLFAIVLLFSIMLSFNACSCSHEWEKATCTTPKTCKECNITKGEANGHTPGEWIFVEDSEGNLRPGIRTQVCKDCEEVLATDPGLFYNEDGTLKHLPQFMNDLGFAAENITSEEGIVCGQIKVSPTATDDEHIYNFVQEGSSTARAIVAGMYQGAPTSADGPVDSASLLTICEIGDESAVKFAIALSATMMCETDPTIGTYDECLELIVQNIADGADPIEHNGLKYTATYTTYDGNILLGFSIDVID